MSAAPDEGGGSGEVKLLPCPFCGEQPKWRWHTGDALWLECEGCGCIGPQDEDSTVKKSGAIAGAWNTRTPDPRIADLEQEVREAISEAILSATILRSAKYNWQDFDIGLASIVGKLDLIRHLLGATPAPRAVGEGGEGHPDPCVCPVCGGPTMVSHSPCSLQCQARAHSAAISPATRHD